MPTARVTAIVLNYKRPDDTIVCLRSLKQTNYAELQLVVVDNHSRDDSVKKIHAEFPDVLALETGKNMGYAGGMNFGIQRAYQFTPDYLLLLNSDTLVDSNVIEILVNTLETHQGAAAASGTIYCYPQSDKVWYAGGEIVYWRASAFTRYRLPNNQPLELIPLQRVTFLSGCAFMVRTSSLQRVGLFDERFFMYVEDAELCARFLSHGFQILYVPMAAVYHKVANGGVEPLSLYFNSRNRLLFLELASNGFSKYLGFLYFFCIYLLKMMFWGAVKPRLFTAASRGIQDFFAGNFYEGRGLTLTERTGDRKEKHHRIL